MTGPAPGGIAGASGGAGPGVGAGPVRRGLRRRQCGLGQPGTLAWPARRAFRAGAVIVNVLVDYVPGGVEQVHYLGREQIARRRSLSVHLGQLLSCARYLLCPLVRATARMCTHHACAPGRPRLRS